MKNYGINYLWTCPPHLPAVSTLPCEIYKVIFDNIIHTCSVTLIILCYLRINRSHSELPFPQGCLRERLSTPYLRSESFSCLSYFSVFVPYSRLYLFYVYFFFFCCFRFANIYSCIAVFLCCYCSLVNKNLYMYTFIRINCSFKNKKLKKQRKKRHNVSNAY